MNDTPEAILTPPDRLEIVSRGGVDMPTEWESEMTLAIAENQPLREMLTEHSLVKTRIG